MSTSKIPGNEFKLCGSRAGSLWCYLLLSMGGAETHLGTPAGTSVGPHVSPSSLATQPRNRWLSGAKTAKHAHLAPELHRQQQESSSYILLKASPCSHSRWCRVQGTEIWTESYKVSVKCLSCEHEHLRSSLGIYNKMAWVPHGH